MAHTRQLSSDPWVKPALAREIWPPLLVLLCSGVVGALVALNAPTAVRAAPVLVYVAVAPGLACARLVGLADLLTELLLGVGLSLALGTMVAVTMLYLRLWSPTLGFAALAAIAAIAAVIELIRGRFKPMARRSRDGGAS